MTITMSEKEYKKLKEKEMILESKIIDLTYKLKAEEENKECWYSKYKKSDKQAIETNNVYNEILYWTNRMLIKEQGVTIYQLLTRKYKLKHIKNILKGHNSIRYVVQHNTMRTWMDDVMADYYKRHSDK